MSYVPPTLEGRVLVDLGQQLTAMRVRAEQAEAALAEVEVLGHDLDDAMGALRGTTAKLEQAEADNARLKVALTTCQQVMETVMAKHEADNARLRAALERSVTYMRNVPAADERLIYAALAATDRP